MISITYNGKSPADLEASDLISALSHAGEATEDLGIIDFKFIGVAMKNADIDTCELEFTVLSYLDMAGMYTITSLFLDNKGNAAWSGATDKDFEDEDEALEAWDEWIS